LTVVGGFLAAPLEAALVAGVSVGWEEVVPSEPKLREPSPGAQVVHLEAQAREGAFTKITFA
jgi:hypothetical protein